MLIRSFIQPNPALQPLPLSDLGGLFVANKGAVQSFATRGFFRGAPFTDTNARSTAGTFTGMLLNSAVTDASSVLTSANSAFLDNATAATIVATFYPRSVPTGVNEERLFSKWNTAGGNQFIFQQRGPEIGFAIRAPSAGNIQARQTSGAGLVAGRVYTVVAVWDGSGGGEHKFWINGRRVTTASDGTWVVQGPASSIGAISGNLTFGCDTTGNDKSTNVVLGGLAIAPFALSEALAERLSGNFGLLYQPHRKIWVPVSAGGLTVNAGIGAATAVGLTATLQTGLTISAGVGAATAAGATAGISLGRTISAGVGAATASGLTASLAAGLTVSAGIGKAVANGGLDPLASSVILLIQPTGAAGSTTFTDLSQAANPLTAVGDVQTSTALSPATGTTVLYDASGDRIALNDASADTIFVPGSGPMCLEFLFSAASLSFDGILTRVKNVLGGPNEWGFYLDGNNAGLFYYGVRGSSDNAIRLFWPSTVATNRLTYGAIQRNSSGEWHCWLNGVPGTDYQIGTNGSFGSVTTGTHTDSVNLVANNKEPQVGGDFTGEFEGQIRYVRFTLATRYTGGSSFTPPAALDQVNANVSLGLTVNAGIGGATATGLTASISGGSTISAGVGAATAVGLTAGISLGRTVAAGIGAATAAGLSATVQTGAGTVLAGIGAATANGLTASISRGQTVGAGIGLASANGLPAQIIFGAQGVTGYGDLSFGTRPKTRKVRDLREELAEALADIPLPEIPLAKPVQATIRKAKQVLSTRSEELLEREIQIVRTAIDRAHQEAALRTRQRRKTQQIRLLLED